jgi:cytochrome c5
MRRVYRKASLVAVVGTFALMFVPVSQSSLSGQRGFQRDPGEIVMNQSCFSCHDLTPIRTQAFDAEGWTMVVETMIDNGATVPAEEIPTLTAYLAGRYGPLPEGDGKPVLLAACTVCHDRERIWANAGGDREHWETTLLAMLNEGAFLTNSEFTTLLNYLARNFGP